MRAPHRLNGVRATCQQPRIESSRECGRRPWQNCTPAVAENPDQMPGCPNSTGLGLLGSGLLALGLIRLQHLLLDQRDSATSLLDR